MHREHRGRIASLVGLIVFATGACNDAGHDRNPLAPEDGTVATIPAAAGESQMNSQLEPYGLGRGQISPSSRPACFDGPHRQFDFWLGKYELTSPGDVAQGTNRITSDLKGCLVEEAFVGADGIRGRSFNAYDRLDGTWLQTFVSELGTNFRLMGGLDGDRMVMSGGRLFPVGGGNFFPVVELVTWTPRAGGAVSQVVELSVDGGNTFPFVTNDITYTPVPHPRPAALVGTGACAGPEFTALDAWEGDWTVRVDGRRIGKSTISRDLSGCALEERFKGLASFEMRSLFSYDATTGTWQRTLVDTNGLAFRLEGSETAEGVALEGVRTIDGEAVPVGNTIEFAASGYVVQRWTFGSDPTVTLIYERK